MKKLHLGIAVLLALICASGIYAINTGGIDDLTTAVSSISNNNEILNSVVSDNPLLKKIGLGNDLSEVGSNVAKETPKITVDENGYEVILLTNSKGEQHKIHVMNVNGNKILRTVTDDMSDEEKAEVMQEQYYWTDHCLESQEYSKYHDGDKTIKINNPYRNQGANDGNSQDSAPKEYKSQIAE